MSVKTSATWDALRTLAYGSISGTYAALGTAILFPVVNMKIYNGTNALLTFSFDSITDNFVIPALSAAVWDIASNRVASGEDLSLKANTTVYVKGSPGSGSVYLEVIYAS
jgi:hypothetical protein